MNGAAPPAYRGYADWYASGHLAPFVTERRTSGTKGIFMIEACQPAGDMSDPAADDLAIMKDVRGSRGIADFGAGRHAVSPRPNSLYVPIPGEASRIIMDCAHVVRMAVMPMSLAAPVFDEARRDRMDFGRLHASSFTDPIVAHLFDGLWEAGAAEAPTSRLFADTALCAIVARMLHLSAVALPFTQGGLAGWQLKRVTEYIDAHLGQDVSLAELAAIADLSPHHFCRAFKQSTGLPPHAWLTARRMERAQELMAAHPKMGLTEVALCVGYQSQAAFGVAFRRATGVTPGQWRRRSDP